MTEQPSEPKREIGTEGGAYFEKEVSTSGGDFVHGDKYVNMVELDIPKLVEVLQQTLPETDPLPQNLVRALKGFQNIHTQLYEWKELHNFINDILYVLGQFTSEVERLDAYQEKLNLRSLNILWKAVRRQVEILLIWAGSVRYVASQPFAKSAQGFSGPDWAVELAVARNRIDDLIERKVVSVSEYYDAAFEMRDVTEKHMYLADRALRATSEELYNLSRIVLGNLPDDNL